LARRRSARQAEADQEPTHDGEGAAEGLHLLRWKQVVPRHAWKAALRRPASAGTARSAVADRFDECAAGFHAHGRTLPGVDEVQSGQGLGEVIGTGAIAELDRLR